MKTTYRRVQHAAHYAYSHPAVGHDLEQIDVDTESQAGTVESAAEYVRCTVEIPAKYEYHSGYVTRDGVQHWVFVRTAPLSGPKCARCPQ